MNDLITILGMTIYIIFMACCLFVILLLVHQQIVKSKERWQMEQWEREDLSDLITNIDPTNTPFISNIGKTTASKEQARKVTKLRRVQ